jgi:hypothetical protein
MALLRQYDPEKKGLSSQWKTPNSRDRRNHDKFGATSNQCSLAHLTLRALCPPTQSANGILCWEVLRRLSENFQRKLPEKWLKKNTGPCIMTTLRLTCRLLCGRLAATSTTVTPPSLLTGPVTFSYSPGWNWRSNGDILTGLKISRTWWSRWREIDSNNASVHRNPAGISVSVHKGTTSKWMEANRNFFLWLRCGRIIPDG